MRALLTSLFSLTLAFAFSPTTGACGPDDNLGDWAVKSLANDNAVRDQAIAKVRAAGPLGLEAMMQVHADSIRKFTAPGANPHDENWQRLRTAIDQVAQQRDAWTSNLYWYTDLDQALAASKASGKPVLSLRMLGKLCDEYSCANSRFFRTTLYSNEQVSRHLRENFILHWKSVRPVPVVTIDMGDGRTIKRTITGNSIHYILAADGQVIDGLPGLYGPAAFLRGLQDAQIAFKEYSSGPTSDVRLANLRKYHETCSAAIQNAWVSDLQKIGIASPLTAPLRARAVPDLMDAQGAPPAELAAIGQISKGGVEQRLVRAVQPMAANPIKATAAMPRTDTSATRDLLDAATNDNAWVAIAALPEHAKDAQFDGATRKLLEQKNPDALAAGRVAMSKAVVETPMIRALRNLQRSVAEDTVRNEYRVHLTLHQWLAGRFGNLAVEPLNEKVYADLFLTPSSDPWLGLVPADTLSALDDEGLCR